MSCMASVIKFRIPVDQFALAATVETGPNVQLAIERFVAREPDSASALCVGYDRRFRRV